jgi:hypothetical protein
VIQSICINLCGNASDLNKVCETSVLGLINLLEMKYRETIPEPTVIDQNYLSAIYTNL